MGRRSGPDVCEAIRSRRQRVRGIPLPQASMNGRNWIRAIADRRRALALASARRGGLRLRCPGLELRRRRRSAATAQQAAPAGSRAAKKDRLLVEAKQLVYNRDTNVVSAEGNVQLYYQGRVLEADKVIYDRNANRVFAEGHAKMTEADGTVTYSDKFELTDDFKTGFIDSLQHHHQGQDLLHRPARRAQRRRDHDVREGHLHGLRALRGASGAPAALAGQGDEDHPQSRRADDLLRGRDPRTLRRADRLCPLFLDARPDRDAQDRLPGAALRHRVAARLRRRAAVLLEPRAELRPDPHARRSCRSRASSARRSGGTGSTRAPIRCSRPASTSSTPSSIALPPYGIGQPRLARLDRVSTASSSSTRTGNTAGTSRSSATSTSSRTTTSAATSLGSRLHQGIDLDRLSDRPGRSQLFRPARLPDRRPVAVRLQQAAAAGPAGGRLQPDLRRSRPSRRRGIGGEVKLDFNLTSLTRTAAAYQSTGTRLLDTAFSLYDVCPTSATPIPAFPTSSRRPASCAASRATTRAPRPRSRGSASSSTPSAKSGRPSPSRGSTVAGCNLNEIERFTFTSATGQSTISNADQTNFFGTHNENISGDVVPGVGLEWRYPFVASTGLGQPRHRADRADHRAAERGAGRARPPNEDAQSLVFDDTTLFEWNKFSGYDRVEGGVRANAGAQYTTTFNNGGYINALFGQSYQLAGQNSYASHDVVERRPELGARDRPVRLCGPLAVIAGPNSRLHRRPRAASTARPSTRSHRPDRHRQVLRY